MMEGVEQYRVIGKRCFVGNLAWKTTWQNLKDKFRDCGTVVYTNVMRDEDMRSKGWGIVEFETPEEAECAINTMDGIEMDGRNIMVREDREDRDTKPYQQNPSAFINSYESQTQGVVYRGGYAAPMDHEGGFGRGGDRGGGYGQGGQVGGGGGGYGGGGERGGGGGGSGGNGGGGGRGESTGRQVVVQGLPWSYTWKELKDMFSDVRGLEFADVVMGFDGRSRGYGTVRFSHPKDAAEAISKWNEQELEGRTLAVFLDKYA